MPKNRGKLHPTVRGYPKPESSEVPKNSRLQSEFLGGGFLKHVLFENPYFSGDAD